jgi:hypothetical protein
MIINVYFARCPIRPEIGPPSMEEKLSAVDACESPWQHERYEAALDAGRNLWLLEHLKPQTSLGQYRYPLVI